jgi:quercetin dioxygenase-like cupin family protein
MSVDGKIVDLHPGQEVFIPANTPHEALNDEESLMLSFGLEDFYKNKLYNELDVLPKNHGNVQSEL